MRKTKFARFLPGHLAVTLPGNSLKVHIHCHRWSSRQNTRTIHDRYKIEYVLTRKEVALPFYGAQGHLLVSRKACIAANSIPSGEGDGTKSTPKFTTYISHPMKKYLCH